MRFHESLAIILGTVVFFWIIFSSIFNLSFINIGYNMSTAVELNKTLSIVDTQKVEIQDLNKKLEYCEDYKGINQNWGQVFWFMGLLWFIATQIMFYNNDLNFYGKKKK